MVNKNLTEIIVILDRSGSMQTLKSDTIGGFNSFIAEQKKSEGKAVLTLVQFDDHYQIDYEGKDINDVNDLNETSYVPRGSTALLDAVGMTINTVGARLSALEEDKRPGSVIFLVITDGAENASREFQANKVKEMVKHQTDVYKWSFIFMGGGDIESQKEQGTRLGFSPSNTYGFSNTSNCTRSLYFNLSKGVSRRRNEQIAGKEVDTSSSLLTDDEIKNLVQDK